MPVIIIRASLRTPAANPEPRLCITVRAQPGGPVFDLDLPAGRLVDTDVVPRRRDLGLLPENVPRDDELEGAERVEREPDLVLVAVSTLIRWWWAPAR